jgi:hypothetical protein
MAMRLRLSPVIANFFMKHFEEISLERAKHKPHCWFRYVDDTFIYRPYDPGKLIDYLDHLNSVHENISLLRRQTGDDLPFLDTDKNRKPDGSLDHKVYRKLTHTQLYFN